MNESQKSDPDDVVRQHAYSTYARQKDWTRPFVYNAEERESYRAEIGTENLRGQRLLEIGFGQGSLISWARDCGAEVVGAEISPNSVAWAQDAGVELIDIDLRRSAALHPHRFDFIIAFDVFEHMPLHQVFDSLRACAAMLRPGGRLILRFPNAQSPFGLVPQHSDVTHVTQLSPSKIEQILPGSGLIMIAHRPAHRVLGPQLSRRWIRRLRYASQSLFDLLAAFLYPTSPRVTLAPVIVVVLERQGNKR